MDQSMPALISPPKDISCFAKYLPDQAENESGKVLLPGRILALSADLGLASGCLEIYIEKGAEKILDPRLIYLLRMQVSYSVSCPFAIGVNFREYRDHQITIEEMHSLQRKKDLIPVDSYTDKELTALQYALALLRTPVRFERELLDNIRRLLHFPLQAVRIKKAQVFAI